MPGIRCPVPRQDTLGTLGLPKKCDHGEAFVAAYPDSAAAKAFDEIVKKCEEFVKTPKKEPPRITEFREVPFLGKVPVDPDFRDE